VRYHKVKKREGERYSYSIQEVTLYQSKFIELEYLIVMQIDLIQPPLFQTAHPLETFCLCDLNELMQTSAFFQPPIASPAPEMGGLAVGQNFSTSDF